MRLRNTLLLIITAIATTGSVNAAKQCMPCPAGKWSIGGKCEQDCEQGYYCQAGARVACTGIQYCPPGSGNPQNCPAGHTCRKGIPVFDEVSAPVGGCKDGVFTFSGDYSIVINGGRGGNGCCGGGYGGTGASITIRLRVKKAGLSYNLCAGSNGTDGSGNSLKPGGVSSIGYGGGRSSWHNCDGKIKSKSFCNGSDGPAYTGLGGYGGGGGDGESSDPGGGGGAASAFDLGGVRIAIAGGGGGGDGEGGYNGSSAATYNVANPAGWGGVGIGGGGGGASKVPTKGSGTSDYEILEVSVGASNNGSASMSGISAD
ncbi:MAG: hypothetical protein LBI17_02955 [Rickettsiales bacterium]|nr:hypothetical protein [Rickettsiales bacterium]